MRTLDFYSEEEQKTMPFPDLTALRHDAFEAHVAALPRDPRLEAWVQRMTKRYKSNVVGIHAHGGTVQFPPPYTGNGEPVSWKAALFICVYGETHDSWPNEVSDLVVKRAHAWEFGKLPEGTVMPSQEA